MQSAQVLTCLFGVDLFVRRAIVVNDVSEVLEFLHSLQLYALDGDGSLHKIFLLLRASEDAIQFNSVRSLRVFLGAIRTWLMVAMMRSLKRFNVLLCFLYPFDRSEVALGFCHCPSG